MRQHDGVFVNQYLQGRLVPPLFASETAVQIPYVEPGTRLFRFLDHRATHFWTALADILSKHELYLNSRTQFNDVFDSRPEIDDDLDVGDFRKQAKKLLRNPWNSNLDMTEIAKLQNIKASRRTLLNRSQIQRLRRSVHTSTDEFLNGCGLLSFSLTATHPLLWAHYAAGCTGICVAFRRNDASRSAFNVCARVSYAKDRPRLPLSLFYKMRNAQRANRPIDNLADQIFHLSFLHKSDEWAHEQEARVYYPFKARTKISFDPDELVGIVMGPKSSKELEDRVSYEVRQHAPSVSICRASLVASGFGIIVPDSKRSPDERSEIRGRFHGNA